MPDPMQIIFIIGAVVALGGALMVVVSRNLFHAALWLVVALFGVAILFVLLEAGFLAAAQVVVYIGAIATLIIFAVMLTRRVMQPQPEADNSEWPLSLLGAVLLFILLAAPFAPFFPGMIERVDVWNNAKVAAPPPADTAASLAALGRALVDAGAAQGAYAVPFELASVLLLGALVGSIVIARDKR